MTEESAAKAKPFFDRADQVAETGNWDYAVEMYLQGISRDVENIERGHSKLREVALRRKASGGKAAGFMEALKHKASKDPLESLVNAEWLMSRDIAATSHWKAIVEAAKAGGWKEVVRWAGELLAEINRTGKKPSKEIYTFLTETYASLELFTEAVRACQAAANLDPNSAELQDRLRNLSAQQTMQAGKYDGTGSFTQSVANMQKQMDLLKGDQISQDQSWIQQQIIKARAAYEAEPTVPGKIIALVDMLTKTDDESYENEAIDVLAKAQSQTGTYRYKMRVGDIRMRQMARQYQKLAKAGNKPAAQEMARKILAFELTEYAERASNYPTDMNLKYELGRRQYLAGQIDEAIASLQQATRDPKRRLVSLNLLGMAFFKKGWHSDAAATFQQALETELGEARQKEVRYNLAMVYKAMGKAAEALDQFSQVARIDYNYRDVRQQIELLRNPGAGEQPDTPPTPPEEQE